MKIIITFFITILSIGGMFWLHNVLDGIIDNVKSVWSKLFWVLVTFVVLFFSFSWCLGCIATLFKMIL